MTRWDEARTLHENGLSTRDIALKMGVLPSTVREYLTRLKNPDLYHHIQRSGQLRRKRARGVESRSEIKQRTIAKTDVVMAAINRGMSYSEAAAFCGFASRNTVAGIVSRHRRREGRSAQ